MALYSSMSWKAWTALATMFFIFWLAVANYSSLCFTNCFLAFNSLVKVFIFSLDELLLSIATIKSFLKLEASTSSASTFEVAITAFSSLAKY